MSKAPPFEEKRRSGRNTMPRANRHFYPATSGIFTHRCHQTAFLLKFARTDAVTSAGAFVNKIKSELGLKTMHREVHFRSDR